MVEEFIISLERRCRELEERGYSFLRNVPNEVNLYGSIGHEIDGLISEESAIREYIIVPDNATGSSHRIYARNIK